MIPDLKAEQLFEQWEDSRDSGSPIDPMDLCADYPELLNVLLQKIDESKIQDNTPAIDKEIATDETVRDFHPDTVSLDSSFVDLHLFEQGGIGVVYRAVDSKLNRNVAIKFLNNNHAQDKKSIARFQREAEITARLDHPGVVPVYAIGQTDKGQPFYSMRIAGGESMQRAIERVHRPSQRDTESREKDFRSLLRHFVSACRTLAFAHAHDIVHHDISPEKIRIGAFGETLVVEWGMALPIDRKARFRVKNEVVDQATAAQRDDEGKIQGDLKKLNQEFEYEQWPAYMSPEQVAGRTQILPASDIFSLGSTLYTLMTGVLAFAGESSSHVKGRILEGNFCKPRKLNPALPRELESICVKAMLREPSDRFLTANDMADDIENWLDGTDVKSHRYSRLEKLNRWSRRHPVWVTAVVTSLLFMGLLALVVAGGLKLAAQHQINQQGDAQAALESAIIAQSSDLKSICQLMSKAIARDVESQSSGLQEIADSPELIELMAQPDPWGRRTELEKLLDAAQINQGSHAISLFLLDAKGNLLVRSSDDLSVIALNQNRRSRAYFHGGEFDLPKESQAAPISKPSLSPVTSSGVPGQTRFSISAPIRNATKDVIGVLGATILLHRLPSLVDFTKSDSPRIRLVESRGKFSGQFVYDSFESTKTEIQDQRVPAGLLEQMKAGLSEDFDLTPVSGSDPDEQMRLNLSTPIRIDLNASKDEEFESAIDLSAWILLLDAPRIQ